MVLRAVLFMNSYVEKQGISDKYSPFANEDGFILAGDKDICFFVDGDTITSKSGNGAIIRGLTFAHEGLGEVGKQISGGGSSGQVFEREWRQLV